MLKSRFGFQLLRRGRAEQGGAGAMNAPPQSLETAPRLRPATPPRDPPTPGYVEAKELPDGEIPSAKADGNFILGPTHPAAPEMAVLEGVPHGQIFRDRKSTRLN